MPWVFERNAATARSKQCKKDQTLLSTRCFTFCDTQLIVGMLQLMDDLYQFMYQRWQLMLKHRIKALKCL